VPVLLVDLVQFVEKLAHCALLYNAAMQNHHISIEWFGIDITVCENGLSLHC
jgi:hypothetical protein